MDMLPSVLFFGFVWWMLGRQMRQMGGMMGGRAGGGKNGKGGGFFGMVGGRAGARPLGCGPCAVLLCCAIVLCRCARTWLVLSRI
jgi:hypothetical protein